MSEAAPARAPAEDALRVGLLCGIAAYAIWGVFPVYFKAVESASAAEILAHRILWSVPVGALVLFVRRQWPEVAAALASPRVLAVLAVTAIAISANWLIYIIAVVSDRVLEASLGYYINPLMYVAAGVFIMREKLRRAQLAAVALAAIGVLTLTVGAGTFPWMALALAVLFTAYGYLRKTAPVGAMPGLFIETCLLAPVAFVYLALLTRAGEAAFLARGAGFDALLMLAGPATVAPLVLFALAARRLRLSTLGFLQYIGPTGQFFLGLYYGEAFTLAHAISFGFIWIALAIFSVDAARANQAEKLARTAAGAPAGVVTKGAGPTQKSS